MESEKTASEETTNIPKGKSEAFHIWLLSLSSLHLTSQSIFTVNGTGQAEARHENNLMKPELGIEQIFKR